MAPKYILGKTDSLTNDSVKSGHLHVKDWNRSLPLTQDLKKKTKTENKKQNQFKMNQIPNSKGKYKENNLKQAPTRTVWTVLQ